MYNETYDDYIRSVLGYHHTNPYSDYQDYRNQDMNFDFNTVPTMNPVSMNTTSDMELENSYPEIYKIVYPMICKKCDNMRSVSITNDDIQSMTDEIYYALEERNEVRTIEQSNTSKIVDRKPDVKISEVSGEKRETRQINRGVRDLIQILLIRELLRRRRRPRPPMHGPRPPMRPPFRPGHGRPPFNRDFEFYDDMFEM